MIIEEKLEPRITAVPPVSDHALAIFKDSLVWDNMLPWIPGGGNGEHYDLVLPRFREVGVNFASLSIAASSGPASSLGNVLRLIAQVRREIDKRADWIVLAKTVADIRKAQAEGKLAVNFNFQETLPFENCLDFIQLFYDLGVRQALLAYNQKNLVGDGCAEPMDGGLSIYGIEVVKEMHRVGMLVDGSHSSYRTTMQAMDLGGGPFIFSHSNPYSVRPHYRNIKDDQIKACAASGGVIGINGVGWWVGDVNARTESIFRCLDYAVELVGPEHVGLGFDYLYTTEGVGRFMNMVPLIWPPHEGEAFGEHNFAGSEQMVELVQVMIDHGYGNEAIKGILGENWARVCDRVWK